MVSGGVEGFGGGKGERTSIQDKGTTARLAVTLAAEGISTSDKFKGHHGTSRLSE